MLGAPIAGSCGESASSKASHMACAPSQCSFLTSPPTPSPPHPRVPNTADGRSEVRFPVSFGGMRACVREGGGGFRVCPTPQLDPKP